MDSWFIIWRVNIAKMLCAKVPTDQIKYFCSYPHETHHILQDPNLSPQTAVCFHYRV